MDVLTRSEQATNKDANERLQQLEKALEEALIEREEILEAAEKEISKRTNSLRTLYGRLRRAPQVDHQPRHTPFDRHGC